MSHEALPKVYAPKEVEERWMEEWLQSGLYHAEASSEKEPFAIVIPPPNVTGVLHMGHALNNTLQDILCRYKRMRGFNVLWVPGTDHAGIATQNVVERKLAEEGKSRHDLGREAFVAEAWKWKEQHGGHIIHQLKRLGASCDWERERFTMDEGLSQAVREAFVSLHKKGLIFRSNYLINWCPRCHTALSDLEVEHEEQKGHLWHIRYSDDIVVATTRPETMLGDTAVAVHPDDERYKSLVGKTVVLPLVEREIPIIADHRVDKEFGSGAVKITPAHDFNDFQMGNEHGLERINLFTITGEMNENAIHFKGQDRFECRKNIVEELAEKGFLVKVEDHLLSVGHCYRCKTVVEPYLSLQWFVKAKPLADRALAAVKKGETKFHPAHWSKTYTNWMENIQDWCISRQIWWGHRIPAWYCGNEECSPIVALETPTQCDTCGGTQLEQDPDVLDTWFSSALWPFSTLGWPEQTQELKTFYPTTVLVTAFDIIFFWVARMMMMGLEMRDEVPFKDVYIHALVRDAEGKKMSKSKGNVIDPLEIMDRFGTDAFRFTLAALAVQGRDVKLSEEIIQGYRNFCNKIWNASRFALMNLGAYRDTPLPSDAELTPSDRWILFHLGEMIADVTEAIENYHYDDAAKSSYHFFWHTFCDWYVEIIKLDFQSEGKRKEHAQAVLYHVLSVSLHVLHPIMPFITEEISKSLPGERPELLERSDWPDEDWSRFKKDAQQFSQVTEIVEMVRIIRSENRISPATKIPIWIVTDGTGSEAKVDQFGAMIQFLTKAESLQIFKERPTEKALAHGVAGGVDIYIPLKGLIDLADERERLTKEIKKLELNQERIGKKLANRDFIDRAPEEVVTAEKEKQEALFTKISRLKETLNNLA